MRMKDKVEEERGMYNRRGRRWRGQRKEEEEEGENYGRMSKLNKRGEIKLKTKCFCL